MKRFLILCLTGTLGCTSVATKGPPPEAVRAPDPQQSLFRSDSAVLSDEEIARILSTKVELPTKIRIALLYLDHTSVSDSYRWRDNRKQNELRLAISPVERLLKSERVYDASYLPDFLISQDKSVAVVREAAARYQADWVLLFRTETRSYEKDRLFGSDEARSYCVAECAVLDVRTGIIPFTSRAARDLSLEKTEDELSLEETKSRAEVSAIEAAMGENIENLLGFLTQLSVHSRSD